MRNERKAASVLASILLVSLLLSFSPQTTINQKAALQVVEQVGIERALEDTTVAGIPHGTIVINGDGEFKLMVEAESWPGNGDEESPYIIEGFDFDLGGTSGNAIYIADTTVHFIIRNCSFTGAIAPAGTGIRLWNVSNCEVSNNTLYDNYVGMLIRGNNSAIVGNTIDPVSGNIGIETNDLRNSVISENTMNGGMIGLSLFGLDQCEVSHNIVTGSPDTAMYLFGSEFVTVSDNDFSGAVSLGIYLEFADNCTIIRNNASYSIIGILLDQANDNLIRECTVKGNTNGMSFRLSWDNEVEFCDIRDSPEYGVLLDSSSTRNLFRWNVLLNLTLGEVQCNGIVNLFDYNLYGYYVGSDENGDGIGDFPYPMQGTTDATDYHPLLMEPTFPGWDPSPTNQVLEFGERFSYKLDVSSPVPITDWELDDKTHFRIDGTGTILDLGILEVGAYPIDVTITNSHGLSLEGRFTVTVEDNTNPVWISQIQDMTYSHGQDIEIQIIAWDLAGIDSWDISDAENFSISSTSFAETGIVTISEIGDLAAGTYSLAITAYDPSGNYVAASFAITVTAAPGGVFGFESIMSIGGLALGLIALIIALVAVVNTRKSS
ncbi:MAG: NosD domain-containing protein [Candidatus Thorarchaeota archaeon]|jgi:parallel beta-helix repeat protein